MQNGPPPRPVNRAFAVLHAAEEGDKLLFRTSEGPRKQPLEVTDVGGTEEAGHYVVLRGPRGGQPALREHPKDGGWSLRYYYGSGEGTDRQWKPVRDIWFVEQHDSPSIQSLADAADEAVASRLAQDDYDEDVTRAAHEVSKEYIERADEKELRALLRDLPDASFSPAEGFNHPTRAAALTRLEDLLIESSSDYSQGSLDMQIQAASDYQKFVDRGVTMAREYVNKGLADSIEEASRQAAEAQLNGLTTADHLQVVEMAPPPEQSIRERLSVGNLYRLVPWGNREDAFEQAAVRLQASIIEEHRHESRQQMKSDSGRLRTYVDTFIDAVSGYDADTSDLTAEVEPDIPLLADGGAPHTTVDEANLLFNEAAPVVAGDWRLCDPGIVSDDEHRHLVWCNEKTEEVIVLTGARQSIQGENPPVNEWGVYVLDTNGTSQRLYDGQQFTEALDAAKDYIVPDNDGPQVELTHNGTDFVTMQTDVDLQELGHRVVNGDGGSDITEMLPNLGRKAGGAAATVARAAGVATKEAGGRLASDFWKQYEGRIGQLVLVLLVAGLLQGITKHVSNIDSRIIAQFNALGIDVIYNRAGDASTKAGSMSETFSDRDVEVIDEELEVGRGPRWLFDKHGVLRLRGTMEASDEGGHFQGTVNPWPVIASGGAILLARESPRIGQFLREWGETFHAEVTGGKADLDDDDDDSDSRSRYRGGRSRSSSSSSGSRPYRGGTTPGVKAPKSSPEDDKDRPNRGLVESAASGVMSALVEGSSVKPNEILEAFGEDAPGSGGGTPNADRLEEKLGDASRTELISMMLNEPNAMNVVVDADDLWPGHMSEDDRDEFLQHLRDHANNEEAWGDSGINLPGECRHLDDRLVEALIASYTEDNQPAQTAMLEKYDQGQIGSEGDTEQTWESRKERKRRQKEAAAEQRREEESPGQRWAPPTEEGEETTETGGMSVDELMGQVERSERSGDIETPSDDDEESFMDDPEELQEYMENIGMFENMDTE